LESAEREELIESSLPSHVPSRSIVEVSENMRAKIYGLFCKLGKLKNLFNRKKQIINLNCFCFTKKGFNDLSGITNQDQLTLCIIENYLDFKV
jgi:hypothetical protein